MRPFVPWSDPCLRRAAAPVVSVDDAVRALWRDLLDTMAAMPGPGRGVGLAAPQIGVPLRVAVVDASDAGNAPVWLANPVLLEVSGPERVMEEASPNLPGVVAPVARPGRVRVGYLGADGRAAERRFDGLWAASVQHQIDHLDGRLYIDRLSRTRRAMLLRRAAKRLRKAG